MNKEQAYETVNFLISEAGDNLITEVPNIQMSLILLASANYISEEFEMKEDDEIREWLGDTKEDIFKYLENYRNLLNSIWI